MFQERLNTMVQWFDQWNESGQTVALFKMLTRLPPTQARFVAIALEHSLTECAELALREQEANNPGFVSGLLTESKEVAMTQLLLHLPLLRPGNVEAKHRYLGVVPAMLSYSLETGCFMEEARQLLAYVLIHPALRDDRRTFEPWRKSLGERIMNGSGVQPATNSSGDVSQAKVRRSNSLTPPFAVTPSNDMWSSQDDLSVVRKGTNRRFSLSLSEHSTGPPLSPQSSQASSGSGSESHLDDLRPGYEAPGMKDVRVWLKSLRLHKYSRLFSQLTYAQMLALSDDTFEATLEQIGAGPVTQGARRKIILSIAKLRDRYSNLCQLEQEVMGGKNLLSAMDEIKAILQTPLKPYAEDDRPPVDDLPSQITKVLGKVCTQLIVCGVVDEEALTMFLTIVDLVLRIDAFTSQQKRKITSWRLQINQQLRQLRQNQQQQYGVGFLPVPGLHLTAPPPTQYPTVSHPQTYTQTHRNSLSVARSHAHLAHTANFLAKRPSLQDPPLEFNSPDAQSHILVQRTQSAPPNPPAPAVDSTYETDRDLNSRLESLCLRMTEQAIGSLEL